MSTYKKFFIFITLSFLVFFTYQSFAATEPLNSITSTKHSFTLLLPQHLTKNIILEDTDTGWILKYKTKQSPEGDFLFSFYRGDLVKDPNYGYVFMKSFITSKNKNNSIYVIPRNEGGYDEELDKAYLDFIKYLVTFRQSPQPLSMEEKDHSGTWTTNGTEKVHLTYLNASTIQLSLESKNEILDIKEPIQLEHGIGAFTYQSNLTGKSGQGNIYIQNDQVIIYLQNIYNNERFTKIFPQEQILTFHKE